MRIAFVIPWYGETIGGGAEAECRTLVKNLQSRHPEIKIEVITTALKEFASDWNINVHKEGTFLEAGVTVHRFVAERKERRVFRHINGRLLMTGGVDNLWKNGLPRSPLPRILERYYISRMVHSKSMYRFLEKNYDSYDLFIFIPYMFGTTYQGSFLVKDKAVLIPCLHDERYIYMRIYRAMMQRLAGVVFHVPAEQRLANRIYKIEPKRQFLLGEMVDTDVAQGKADLFRMKYRVSGDFILYAGRKISGKNLHVLVDYFKKAKALSPLFRELKLVLLGKGDLDYSNCEDLGIIDLGFVPLEDKINAYRAATFFCMPSNLESFSIVIMESWLQGTPILVSNQCEVTRDHVKESGGGLTFFDQKSFQDSTEWFLQNKKEREEMGKKGRQYVLENYSPPIIVDRFVSILEKIKNQNIDKSDLERSIN